MCLDACVVVEDLPAGDVEDCGVFVVVVGAGVVTVDTGVVADAGVVACVVVDACVVVVVVDACVVEVKSNCKIQTSFL